MGWGGGSLSNSSKGLLKRLFNPSPGTSLFSTVFRKLLPWIYSQFWKVSEQSLVLILPPGSNMSQYLSHKILPCEGRILLSEALRCLPRIFPQTRSWSSNFRAGKRNHFSFILLNKCSDLDRWHLWVTSTISTQPTTACRPSFTSTWSVSNKMPPLPKKVHSNFNLSFYKLHRGKRKIIRIEFLGLWNEGF